ncbi:hypothetical protein MPSEU_000492500 [Mayamaea pseudoterrestris]|nr:hypothetical protein MPSEU_000492500 [Mayamaea pseudoterrestris]
MRPRRPLNHFANKFPLDRIVWSPARLVAFISIILLWTAFVLYSSNEQRSNYHHPIRVGIVDQEKDQIIGPCAINFYGVPRSFQGLVLPSIIENVVLPNLKYRCDYFVHYHHRLSEPLGRDGRGGYLEPEGILDLKSAIRNVSRNVYQPRISFTRTAEEEFLQTYHELLHVIHDEKDSDGQLLFTPVNHPSYDNNTIDNVVRMFHGQAAVWHSMSKFEQNFSQHHFYRYSRVAMLRNDVFYATPIDIYRLPDGFLDIRNEYAVIPGFSQHPVNDRLIYGPADAVRIWAATRFERLWKHAQFMKLHHPGDGIHSERFLAYTIFPAIRDAGIPILVDNDMCFLRVRSDQSIRLDDCRVPKTTATGPTQQTVEALLHRSCYLNETQHPLMHLECRLVM